MYIKIKDYSNIHPEIDFKKWYKVEYRTYNEQLDFYETKVKNIDYLIKDKDIIDTALFFPKILEMREKYVNRKRLL